MFQVFLTIYSPNSFIIFWGNLFFKSNQKKFGHIEQLTSNHPFFNLRLMQRSKRGKVPIILITPFQHNCLVFFDDSTVLSLQGEPVIEIVIVMAAGFAVQHFYEPQMRWCPVVVVVHWDLSERLDVRVCNVLYRLPLSLIKNTMSASHSCCVKWKDEKGKKVKAFLGLHCKFSERMISLMVNWYLIIYRG